MRTADAASVALVALALLGGLVALPLLPAELAVHFDAAGQPDSTLPAPVGVLVVPAVAGGVLLASRRGSLVGAGADRVAAVPALAVTAGVCYVQGALLAMNAGLGLDPLAVVLPGVAVILLGTAYGRARPV